MKLVVTQRAPHLGPPGSTVEMTKSQAAYERLRGHLVPHVTVVEPVPSQSDTADQAGLAKVVRRARRKPAVDSPQGGGR
ncbi:hypothetical protein P9273_21350 [Mesorhizobium sp. WSM4935]|uniref:hypothetical protein n=1 Tax=Mesorhizobium sp. WSM4935 TaxID=3038547 RepID=UPI00241567BD|nr:hypothetical protein [Mesorhizobium sp. WSM4935]MDG4877652.1 hypothetical protein [Mesorhizobium sp. WSM4935]